MDTDVYKLRLARWQRLVYEANTSGMKKNEWCRINGVSEKQFYYWQKKVRAMALDEMNGENGQEKEGLEPPAESRLPAFVELKPPAASGCLSYGGCPFMQIRLSAVRPGRAEIADEGTFTGRNTATIACGPLFFEQRSYMLIAQAREGLTPEFDREKGRRSSIFQETQHINGLCHRMLYVAWKGCA